MMSCLKLRRLLATKSTPMKIGTIMKTSLKVAEIFDKRDEMKKDLR